MKSSNTNNTDNTDLKKHTNDFIKSETEEDDEIRLELLNYMKKMLDVLYRECEHGDEEHRKWLREKFDDFLKRI